MKVLTINFVICAIKTCKATSASFPLHPRDSTLEIVESELNLAFLQNILPRLSWEALVTLCVELSLPALPATAPTRDDLVEKTEESGSGDEEAEPVPTQTARDLHRLLLETCIVEGKLVCGNCGHEYAVKEGVANFLLPAHLV